MKSEHVRTMGIRGSMGRDIFMNQKEHESEPKEIQRNKGTKGKEGS
jgi:hypothetical protein